ncbi:Dihydrofolate synthetase [Komagataella phaffii CBS 7435]|uniref:Dihydrofolate synthetase n=2 Tax=Komagataella phaffii TaxID=460519 RepID=C4QX69_KOMPG|nr:Dihydrofolate synthetase [Komagataella phaffii GS115]AOA61474.1 GQ67_02182T0 [Komagataella phaffii]CAH2446646.1 Dihydrofolate synthetase [Komagataella phaffii CBS 7435]AOA65647.1 GQ68_02197T0 [Komagataella phaffii GS115]CAY67842.1 Dihydrofolate synthetase [Komagataella phaffii GS115]CCA36922.1 Dihydrofolate synthetase [Komagataella phaffii CBS 7435]
MPIDLSLGRVTQLLTVLGNPQKFWKCIHVAGTNGKGSVCSYLSHILESSNISTGRFTSPHLFYPNDSININNRPISRARYDYEFRKVKELNERELIGATEFELLTCTAFYVFAQFEIEVAVVEVGLGGRLDATNVIPGFDGEWGVLVSAITKIGLDHESLLGNSLTQIAKEKAGIIKESVPCVIDGSNDTEILRVVKDVAFQNNCKLFETFPRRAAVFDQQVPLLGEFQKSNLAVALKVADILRSKFNYRITEQAITNGVRNTKWPGRLQRLTATIRKQRLDLIVDGAHNGQAAIELSKYLDTLRTLESPLTFVIAVTEGKTLTPMLAPLIKKQDFVTVTTFSSVEGMPWIKAMDCEILAREIRKFTSNVTVQEYLEGALINAAQFSQSPTVPLIVCGSLYLAADVLKFVEKTSIP